MINLKRMGIKGLIYTNYKQFQIYFDFSFGDLFGLIIYNNFNKLLIIKIIKLKFIYIKI